MEELLSVIVPVYNVKDYLAKCLNSIINQTYKNLEIICINDGSTDGSDQILIEYAKKDLRIKVVHQSNSGLSAARNKGIKLAKGKYIAFVDSDDYINQEIYSLCIPLFLLDIDIVIFSVKIIVENFGIDKKDDYYFQVHQQNKITVTPKILKNENVMSWNKIYKAEIIKQNSLHFYEGLWYEDVGFYWQYMSFVKNAYYLDNKLYNYVRHPGSIMHLTFLGHDKSLDYLKVYANLLVFWLSDKKFQVFIAEVGALLFENAFKFSYTHATSSGRKNVLVKAKKIINDHELNTIFPQNKLIQSFITNSLYQYKWIDEYNLKQKFFSIKKFKYEKIICILGIKIKLKL